MATLATKSIELLRRPEQILTRIGNKLQAWRDRTSKRGSLQASSDPAVVERRLAELLGTSCLEYLSGAGLGEFEEDLRESRLRLADAGGPFSTAHNGTPAFGRLCYAACRALKPLIAIETGVAYGVTSAYILRAMHDNGAGKLYSIDLPPLGTGAERYVGALIPASLRSRWELRLGDAAALLPQVLGETGPIDLFVHDSLHTYRHMKWEFDSVLPRLNKGSFLVADDIEFNTAFEEALAFQGISSWCAVAQPEKNGLCGIIKMKEG